MRKIMLAGILILFTVSCAPLMEETWTVTTPKGPVTVRHYDPARELLMGFYISSLITNPPKGRNDLLLSSYYYPPIIPRVQKFGSLPTWEDVLYDMEVESAIRNQLRDYESEVEHINDMELWRLKTDTQRMIDDIESAKERAKDELESKKKDAEDAADELKDAAYDAKLELKRAANKLEDAAWWAKFRLGSAAENAAAERSALDLDWLNSIPPKKVLSTEGFFHSTKRQNEKIDFTPGLPPLAQPGETKPKVPGIEKKGEFDITSGLPSFTEEKPPSPLGGEIGQVIGKSEDQVEVTQWFGSSAVKKFVSVGVDYAKRAGRLYFSVERAISGPDDPGNLLYSGEIVVYGTRGGEKEISRIVKNGLANAIKEIIDEAGER